MNNLTMYIQLKDRSSKKEWGDINQTKLNIDSKENGIQFCKQLSTYTGKNVRMTMQHPEASGRYFSPDMYRAEERRIEEANKEFALNSRDEDLEQFIYELKKLQGV